MLRIVRARHDLEAAQARRLRVGALARVHRGACGAATACVGARDAGAAQLVHAVGDVPGRVVAPARPTAPVDGGALAARARGACGARGLHARR